MNVGVLYGGKSCEHSISIITAVQVMNNLDKKHKCIPIYIDNQGVWWCGKDFDKLDTYKQPVKGKKVHLAPQSNALYLENGKKHEYLDVVILCNHGINGEDGLAAGVLEYANIPYAGSSLHASAAGMDKILFKNILTGQGLPITKYVGISKYDYQSYLYDCTQHIKDYLRCPLIIKPANLGSSIGIGIAKNYEEMFALLSVAFELDTRVIVEEALTDFIEVNCGVLGYGDEYIISEVEQPVGWKDFLSFRDKYEGGFKGGSGRNMPANISDGLRYTVRDLALKTFKTIDAAGVARVDFLIKGEDVYINEINTIPGSLANYLFSFDGINFRQLLEKMIELALKAHRDKGKLKYSYKTPDLFQSVNGNKYTKT